MSIVEMKVPVIGESVTEVTLSEWLKADGEYVERDEAICEFESDKATLEFPAEAAGRIIHVAAEGDDLEIGALVAKIDTSAAPEGEGDSAPAEAAPQESTPAPAAEAAPAAKTDNYATGTPSPAAGKILREAGVDAASVNGTGRDGRITKDDAQKAATSPAPAPAPQKAAPAPAPAPKPATAFSREQRVEKMSRMRRTIASRLVSAKNETAMLTTFNEVDLTEVMALRKRVQEQFVAKYGVKLGFMSIFAKACAQVLMEMPDVNAHIGEDGKSLIYHDYVDISFAVSTPTGLVVPPINNIESLGFADIEKNLKDLAVRARDNKLSMDEMSGGTFTITNGGVFGSMLSTPIINQPQSAILGMHNIIQRPVAVNGQVEIRPMMYLALSYDHRVIDGSSSVTFLVKVIKLLEDPTLLLLGL
ncbi:2-oxoglutarate dehydrogenase complex dihydrolipoyllysine-residue succinyltransferase [Neolewinella aurantiaca]|uniref:Dihydrolipoyllysine-residue succinyltransferase component of 2-oxoglutarate dehydrogenase complex n=1 Tax=Neolewinella aurantiaca TaxID=2602767 RepID=A0A5C7FTV8_9BACT|nr:2-oxoglutarate dehydrogenase complex dihydrolipoyllysine-residue succinyltransferase [Neolewinella aurantiaca]TXF88300.1 2-oxoglutarate dehydrogenase complex dihydrolipoyllysine-residue succinyltransferase [Neolewinella aurantiaca]